MKIQINETEYQVKLDHNETVQDLLENLPLEMELSRYAGHEYYSSLPFTPRFDINRTSHILAGHIYYWDGWNAFVINFEDCDISPYKVVHIGEIEDSAVSQILSQSGQSVFVNVSHEE